MESIQKNIRKTIEIIYESEDLKDELSYLSSDECSLGENFEDNDDSDTNEDDHDLIPTIATNPLGTLDNSNNTHICNKRRSRCR